MLECVYGEREALFGRGEKKDPKPKNKKKRIQTPLLLPVELLSLQCGAKREAFEITTIIPRLISFTQKSSKKQQPPQKSKHACFSFHRTHWLDKVGGDCF